MFIRVICDENWKHDFSVSVKGPLFRGYNILWEIISVLGVLTMTVTYPLSKEKVVFLWNEVQGLLKVVSIFWMSYPWIWRDLWTRHEGPLFVASQKYVLKVLMQDKTFEKAFDGLFLYLSYDSLSPPSRLAFAWKQ